MTTSFCFAKGKQMKISSNSWARIVIGLLCTSGIACPSIGNATTVSLDEFKVIKNGNAATPFLLDTFSDGVAPPSGPNGATTYFVSGTIPNTAETGGRLSLSSDNGELSANALEMARTSLTVRLNSNIDQGDLTAGLKSDDALVLTGLFDLAPVTGVFNPQYSIRFADTPGSGVGNHQVVQLQDRHDTALKQDQVRYILQDFDANTITVLGSAVLAPPAGANQILLSISRPDTSSNNFFGSFSLLSGGATQSITSFGSPGQMFIGENFVRAEVNISDGVIAAVPEPSTYVMFLAGLGLSGFVARRRRSRAGM
jgi:hypothetical protein